MKDFIQSREGLQFSEVLGVPLLSEESESFKSMLSFEAYDVLIGLKELIQSLEQQSRSTNILKLTRERLKNLIQGYSDELKILESLFRPLGQNSLPFSDLATRYQRRRSGHLLTRHLELVGRDWSWGEKEIKAAIDLTQEVVREKPEVSQILALGAGACRYPFELHHWLNVDFTLCVDISPTLLACAKKIVSGECLEWIDFPIVPKNLESFVYRSKPKTSRPNTKGFNFLVHNIDEWGFKEKSFDCVVTSWLIDVISTPPARLFSLINSVLKPGGYWINLGPLGFNKTHLAHYFSLEETKALIEKAQFKIQNEKFSAVPYLQHPASSHWRTEHVYCFIAQKQTDALPLARTREKELPSWAEETNQPFELANDKTALKLSYQFCLDLINALDECKSVDELADKLAKEHPMPELQLKQLITGILLQWGDLVKTNPLS